MKQRISDTLRLEISQRALYRCEYCLIPESFLASIFHVDHIRSRKHGGKTVSNNLAYACPHCNQNKGSDIATFIDENDDMTIRFFNPRKDKWHDHFEINEGQILAQSPVGNATIKILDFNQPERIILRQALISIGEYLKF